VSLGLVSLVLGSVVAYFLLVRAFATSATVTVENRTSYVTQIGIGDYDIGCGDSEPVDAGTTATVELSFHGPLLRLLCVGDPIRYFFASNASGSWICDWNDVKLDRRVVIADDGPDCPALP
jgi:hypothetical protein